VCSSDLRIEFFDADRRLVAEQQHEDGEADGCFGGRHGEDEEHEDLAVQIAQVVREGHEVQVDRQQHELDGHEQHDQVAAVEEDAHHGDREQDRSDRQEMAQRESVHALPSSALAGATGAATRAVAMGTITRRSLARTCTWSPGLMALLSLRWRSVSAMAATMATSRMKPATWMG